MSKSDTTLDAAAEGSVKDVDIEQARQFLRDAQMVLVGLGYYGPEENTDLVGEIDGVWGPCTQEAVRTFQQDHAIDITGQLDQDTYEALMNAYDDELRGQLEDVQPDQDDVLEAQAKDFLRAHRDADLATDDPDPLLD